MKDIKILDCTLRDGGYINDWNFGAKNSKKIIQSLLNSKIDFIEAGFLTNKKTTKNKTLFNSFSDFQNILDDDFTKEKLVLMIKYNEFPIENIINAKNAPIGALRLIFKKHYAQQALKYAYLLKEKGYKLFVNPTFITSYKKEQILALVEEVNKISPYALSIVDSMGDLDKNTLIEIFSLIDNNLDLNINLCFHSHNNLGLSFSNAKEISGLCTKRDLIIDSSVLGMGRGAGNLNTKVLMEYLNSHFQKNYDVKEILNTEKYIEKFYTKNPKNFSRLYYLSAIKHCHPDYVKFIIQNYTQENGFINSVLEKIEENKKTIYCPKTAQKACLEVLKN